MPLFDLECPACNHRWEDMVRTGATPPPCPACGAEQTTKRITFGASIVPIVIKPGETVTLPRRPPRK